MTAQTLAAKRWRKELARRGKRKATARAKHEAYLRSLKARRVLVKPIPAARAALQPKPKTSLVGRAKSAVKAFLRRTP